MRLQPLSFDRKRTQDLVEFSGVFGFGWIPKKEQARFYKLFVKEFERIWGSESSPPESLARMADFFYGPFVQGRPEMMCPHAKCGNHRKRESMHVLATVQNKPVRGVSLWGSDEVWLVFLICPRCHTILAYNECT